MLEPRRRAGIWQTNRTGQTQYWRSNAPQIRRAARVVESSIQETFASGGRTFAGPSINQGELKFWPWGQTSATSNRVLASPNGLPIGHKSFLVRSPQPEAGWGAHQASNAPRRTCGRLGAFAHLARFLGPKLFKTSRCRCGVPWFGFGTIHGVPGPTVMIQIQRKAIVASLLPAPW
jgi:hypothetical protein